MGMGVLALGFFDEDEKRSDLSKVAEIVGEQVDRTAQKSVELIKARNAKENQEKPCADCRASKCYRSCPRWQIFADPDETFEYLASTKPPDRRVKDVLNGGAVIFGGGSKSGRKRSKTHPKATVWGWFEL